jgi:hypothetical protein
LKTPDSQQTPAAVSFEDVVNWAYVEKTEHEDEDSMQEAQCTVQDELF